MALYFIGDLQGCDAALARLLQTLDFSPSRDTLHLLGDLVNRGPDSLAVLRRLQRLGNAAISVLGNHDLHLLACAHGARRPSRRDTLTEVLTAPDWPVLQDFLRHQRMAHHTHGVLMVHAGVLPSWSVGKTLALAREVEQVLKSPDLPAFLRAMYGNTPSTWHDTLDGDDRLRVIVNALTRLRCCDANGAMDMEFSGGLDAIPQGQMPWFDVPGRRTAADTIAFGHWSTLGWLDRPNLWSLDSGCVWGGCLTAVRWSPDTQQTERISVRCEQAQQPGADA